MSVFLEVPEAAWVCANALAFAFRDRFPVTPGHTLVVTRRVTPDWFTATDDERAAVSSLIADVKRQLDSELAPDGYNVGFNAGLAAGQTVMHLHVHVIPRFRGDMDDPRGGVRHVIPSKANYLRQAAPLATGGDDDPFSRHVIPLFERATDIAIVAAFVQESGLDRIQSAVDAALQRGTRIRVITGDYLNITQAGALETLLDWEQAAQPDDGSPGRFLARVIEVEQLPARSKSFHPKSWRFEAPNLGVAFVGSSNLSRSALESGIEWNLRVDRDRDYPAYTRVRDAFEALWARARPLDPAWIDAYAQRARRHSSPCRPARRTPTRSIRRPRPTTCSARHWTGSAPAGPRGARARSSSWRPASARPGLRRSTMRSFTSSSAAGPACCSSPTAPSCSSKRRGPIAGCCELPESPCASAGSSATATT